MHEYISNFDIVIASFQHIVILTYVTGFGKTCIVHTPDLILSIWRSIKTNKWYTELKFLGKIEEQWFYNP